uniref:Uncharacterized protein n=1 Tax=Romanomermis culicivorax TaxID=13658 RepID=A0A915L0H0_ROMCU
MSGVYKELSDAIQKIRNCGLIQSCFYLISGQIFFFLVNVFGAWCRESHYAVHGTFISPNIPSRRGGTLTGYNNQDYNLREENDGIRENRSSAYVKYENTTGGATPKSPPLWGRLATADIRHLSFFKMKSRFSKIIFKKCDLKKLEKGAMCDDASFSEPADLTLHIQVTTILDTDFCDGHYCTRNG